MKDKEEDIEELEPHAAWINCKVKAPSTPIKNV